MVMGEQFNFVNENVVEKLGASVKDKDKAFIVFCFDIPSEFRDVSEKEKAQLLLKRMNWKNYIDKFSIFVSNSVYITPYSKIQNLLQVFDEFYGDLLDKYEKIGLNILGIHFDNDIVKDILVNHIKGIESKIKNFFEYVLDTKKAKDKDEVDKMERDYKKYIKWLNITRWYRIQDLRLLDDTLSNALKSKLDSLTYNKSDVSYRISVLKNDLKKSKA